MSPTKRAVKLQNHEYCVANQAGDLIERLGALRNGEDDRALVRLVVSGTAVPRSSRVLSDSIHRETCLLAAGRHGDLNQ